MIPVEEVNRVRKFETKNNKIGHGQLAFATVEFKERQKKWTFRMDLEGQVEKVI